MTDLSKEDLYRPGLEGIPACRSKIAFIDGQEGILEYRGYDIKELATHAQYEEVAYLLLKGKLPTSAELAKFESELLSARQLPQAVVDAIYAYPKKGHPMEALQTSISMLGMYDDATDTKSDEKNWQAVLNIISQTPLVVAAFERARAGKPYVAPLTEGNLATNFLYMLTGEKPSQLHADTLDKALTLHAEHTINASTFTARVAAGTLTLPHSLITAGVAALFGPLHGGANERVVTQLESIGSKAEARGFLEDKMAKKEKVMGLGHRVYKTKDPRATILQEFAHELFSQSDSELLKIAEEIETVAGELLSHKGIYPNVDFYSGLVYKDMGIEVDAFTCIFAMARTAGWLAHWLEQLPDNRLYRPTQIYEGDRELEFVPMDKR